MMLRATIWVATLACFVHCAEADLLVSIDSANLTPGSSATVDVLVASDEPLGEALGLFGYEFRISGVGPTRLDFVDPQSDLQLLDPNYVFAGDSLAAAFPPVGIVDTTVLPNDTFVGGDSTFSGGSVTVDATNRLLARLEITAATALPPVVGDTFSIELIAESLTLFQDDSFNDLDFSSTPGTVTIVPEPSSAVLCLAGLFAVCVHGFRRRRLAD
jgi:hypothetical protein